MRLLKQLLAAATALGLLAGPIAQAQISGPGVSGFAVPRKIVLSAIPFIISPTGTMANNGAATLGTALPTTYASAYIYLPAAAIAAGVPAAATWYYTQCSSGTACTVFNNTYTSGLPSIPASPTAFATTGPGAYTGVTSAVTGPQYTMPAGLIGPTGQLRLYQAWSINSNANTKTIGGTIGGVAYQSSAQTTFASSFSIFLLYQRPGGILVSGASNGGFGLNSQANPATFISLNLQASQVFAQVGTLTVATDYLVMEAFMIEAVQ